MAKNFEFRPDPENSGNLDKLLLTQRQRFGLLRWALYGLICVLGLLLQDVLLCRIHIAGACTDLVPCLIIMITVFQGAESGCIFALIATVLYYFSGSATGPYVIPILTGLSVFAVIFRQACLRQGFGAVLICAGGGMLIYEMSLFGIGLFLGRTVVQNLQSMVLTAALSMVVVPLAYPALLYIGRIGGETWKE